MPAKKTVYVLGAGASRSYEDSPTGRKMPLSRDLFETYQNLAISENQWVSIGAILNYGRDEMNIDILSFFKTGIDIEEFHSEVEDKLLEAMSEDSPKIYLYWRTYNQLIFLFTSVINEIQNGPLSKSHLKLAKFLSPDDVIITFNWDTLLDRALNEVYKGWNSAIGYGVMPQKIFRDGWYEPEAQSEISAPKLLKLHGSTNWITSHTTADPKTGNITLMQSSSSDTFYIYEYATQPYPTYQGRYMEGYEPFSYGYYPPNIMDDPGKSAKEGYRFVVGRPKFPWVPPGCSSDEGLVSMPLVIPPVKRKKYDLFGDLFKGIWDQAENTLAESDKIIVIGYSFPRTDHQSTDLFSSAFIKRSTLPKIVIVNPDPERVYFKFKYDFGIPKEYIDVFETYYSEQFDLKNFE